MPLRPSYAVALGLSIAASFGFATEAAGQTTRILAFGDSITIGFRESGVDCNRPDATAKGYPEHLEDLLRAQGLDVSVDPFGVCGETTFVGITRIDQVLSQEPADAIVIMEGTNDVSSGNPIISLESIEANLRMMAEKSSIAGVEPVLASIIPYGPGVDGLQRNERAARMAADLSEIASQDGHAYADVFNFLMAVPDLFTTYYASDGFHLNAAGNELLSEVFVDPVKEALAGACQPGPCRADDTSLCLGPESRFRVTADWRLADGTEGVGHPTALSADTGRFWFFSPENIELVVKVLDGRCFNERYWVFYGALSNVEYTLKVTDTATCSRRTYSNPQGNFASVGDTAAFLGDAVTCP